MSIDWENNNWRDSQPTVAKANRLMTTVGEWFLYLRSDRRYKCPVCFEEPQLSPAVGSCTQCWGLGFVTTPELVQGRLLTGGAVTPREGLVLRNPGYLFQGGETIYLPRQLAPQELDIIAQCEFNVPNKEIGANAMARPLSLSSIYLVKIVYYPVQRETAFAIVGAEPYQNDLNRIEATLRMMTSFRKHTIQPVWPSQWWN